MKTFKQAYKYIALILVLSMILGSMVVFADTTTPNDVSKVQTFSDVPTDHWAYEHIEELVKRGAITGYPDGKFRPELTVTRAEFAKIMVKAADLTLKTVTTSSFADIKITDWFCPFVEAAKSYMTGYKDQTGKTIFKPNTAALREDIVVAIVKLKGYDVRFADVGMLEVMYKDYSSISASARSYVAVAVEKGLISGFPDETFRAQATITRAQVTTILWRAFQYGNDDKITDEGTEEPTTTDKEPPTETEDDANTPEQNEPVKFGVDTLLSNVQRPEYMITNNDGVVYFLVNNQVNKIVDGKAVLIADGDKDFVQKVETGHVASEMLRTSSGLYNNLTFSEEVINDTDLITFKKFEIRGLILDEKLNKVYIMADTEVLMNYNYVDVGNNSAFLLALFDADNIDKPIISYYYDTYNHYSSQHMCDLNKNRYYLINNAVLNNSILFYKDYVVYRYNLTDNIITPYVNAGIHVNYGDNLLEFVSSMIKNSQYICAKHNRDGGFYIYKHDMVNNTIKGKHYYTYETTGNITAITSKNGLFYIMAGANIFTVDTDGEVYEYIQGDNLIIQDGLPIGQINEITIDNDGSVIFYDKTNRAIRRIQK